MEFSRPEYWKWVAYPFSSGLSNPGIEPGSAALQVDSLLTELSGKPKTQERQAPAKPTSGLAPISSTRKPAQAS